MKRLLFIFAVALFAVRVPSLHAQCSCSPIHPVNIGVNTQEPPYFDKARAANLGWVRAGIQWSRVNPAAGVWDITQYDDAVRTARSQGLKILMILFHTPQWAGGGPYGVKPATDIALWQEYVRRVAQRYNGSIDPQMRVDAYEIWNEPDIRESGDGVGWDQDITASPTYVDYVHAAAVEIRTYAPGTLVVGGSYASGPHDRALTIAQQFQTTNYADGNASNFVDVISIHSNGQGSEFSDNTTDRTKFKLNDLNSRNPNNKCKPKWITKYGFASALVGEDGQRDKIRRMTETFAGSHSSTSCSGWLAGDHRVENAFIYVQIDFSPAGTRGIHRVDGTPKRVVTEYLLTLPFPATDF